MRQAVMLAVLGTLFVAGTLGQDLPDDVVREAHRVVGKDEALPDGSPQTSPVNQILVTADNQILVELKEDEDTRPHPFDLNGRTLVFTPDGSGGYSRQVRALEWEEEIGQEVQNQNDTEPETVRIESFDFPFAGRRWDSLRLGPPGVVTFGGPFTFSISYRHNSMQQIAAITVPTISVLFRASGFGETHVARRTDRIAVTWLNSDKTYFPHGVPPEQPARFQTVLGADGSIRFNYIDVPYKDGLVGLLQGDDPLELLPTGADLSRPQSRASTRNHEVFHHRSVPDPRELTCDLLRALGDEFDLFVYNREFHMDTLDTATAWSGGGVYRNRGCTQGRFKGHWSTPVWSQSRLLFNASPYRPADLDESYLGLRLFAHEFGHNWGAYLSYDKSGQQERLSDGAHWRPEFHTPAAFVWRETETPPISVMGGKFWVDLGNGRFTNYGSTFGDGFSWLDLYTMGLADAEEVPDMFIVKNLKISTDPNLPGHETGEKEIFSIDQIVPTEGSVVPWGPGGPGTAHSQKVFNAGFVYLLEPGRTPSGDLLELHARYMEKVPGYWSDITGGRSRITTVVSSPDNNRPPRALASIPARMLTQEGAALEVDIAGFFSDPDGDRLTYQAASSDDAVVKARLSGSMVTITPGTAGTAVVTVTAKDGRGGFAYLAIEISVEAVPEDNPSDFTFVPVILNASGRNDAFFTSELILTHRGNRKRQRAVLDFTYTAHTGGGSGRVRDYLEPGHQLIIPDAVEFLRQRGAPIPGGGKSIGTLRVAFQRTSSAQVGVTVRTTTAVPEGRAGLAYPGVPAGAGFDDAVYLCGLRQNEQDRSNVAFQHMGTPRDGPITLRTTVFSGDAETAGDHVLEEVRLHPGGFYQFNQVLAVFGSPAQGYAKVERVEGTAPFYAYGVINDQANSDGSFVFPVTESSLAGTVRHTLPVIVETGEFTTELTVTNFSGEPRRLDLAFVADGIRTPDKTARFSLTIEPGRQRIIPDIIDTELRRKGVEGLESGRRSLSGALFATARSGDLSGIVIGARTGSPDGRGGQYGLFYNAVPDRDAFTESVWIYGLQQNQHNRTNLALVNTGAVDDSRSTLRIEIFDGDKNHLLKYVYAYVHARRWQQINSILATHAPGTTQGYVRIRQSRGNNPFLAYAVVNDGGAPGQRSGDGAYLPAQK